MKVYEMKVTYSLVREDPEPLPVNMPEIAVKYMEGAFDENPDQESFWVIMLNRKNRPISRKMITLGTATHSLAHPREIFKAAVLASATAIICIHNHPSGDPAPSQADLKVTRNLREAALVMDISLHDHVIIGRESADPTGRGYYSFRESGLL